MENQKNPYTYLETAQKLLTEEKYEEAIALYEKALKNYPAHATLYRNLGFVQEKIGDFDGEILSYQKAIEFDPQQPKWVYTTLAELLKNAEKLAETLKIYQKAVEIYPNNALFYREMAVIQEKMGDYVGQLQSYQECIKLDSQQPVWVYLSLAKFLRETGEFEEAIATYQKAIKIYPEKPELYRELGFTQEKIGDFQGETINYQKAIELNLQQPSWLYQKLGELLKKQNKLTETLNIYQKATAIYPENSLFYRELGVIQEKIGDFEGQIISYQKAIELDQQQPIWVYYVLGYLYREKRKLDQAIYILETAIQLYPNQIDFDITLKLAEIYYQNQDLEKALKLYQKANQIEPEKIWLKSNIEAIYFQKGIHELKQGKIETAINQFKQVNEINLYNEPQFLPWLKDNNIPWPYTKFSWTSTIEKLKPTAINWPKISIVTPSFNQGEYIEETILSVINQNYPNLEYIIVDGQSSDQTQDILRKYQNQVTQIIIEPDHGQSNAINKGFSYTTGELMTWLNSDDMLAPGALHLAAITYLKQQYDLIAGICIIHEDHHIISLRKPKTRQTDFTVEKLAEVGKLWCSGHYFLQPEVIFTRNIWNQIGSQLNEELEYVMDYELWLKMAQKKAKLTVIAYPFAFYRSHKNQKTGNYDFNPQCMIEHLKVRNEFYTLETNNERKTVIYQKLTNFFNLKNKKILVIANYSDMIKFNQKESDNIYYSDQIENLNCNQYDAIIILILLQDELSIIENIKKQGFNKLLIGWFWYNNCQYYQNAIIAEKIDICLPANKFLTDILTNKYSLVTESLPICSLTKDIPNYHSLSIEKKAGLYIEIPPYVNQKITQLIEVVKQLFPDSTIVTENANISDNQRLLYQACLCLPTANEIPPSLLTSFIYEQIPIITDDIWELETLISPELQDSLPIIKLTGNDILSLKNASQKALFSYHKKDRLSRAKALILSNYLLPKRIEQILGICYSILMTQVKTIDRQMEDSKTPFNYIETGENLIAENKYEEAIALYQEALTLYPENATLYRNLGFAQEKIGDFEAEIASYQKAIALDPNQPIWVYTTLAELLKKPEKLEAILDIYQKALEIYPDNALFYRELGVIQEKMGDYAGQLQSYRQSLKLESQQPVWVYAVLAKLLREEGEFEEAIATYQQGIELYPEDANLYRELGFTQEQIGDLQGEIASYQKAIKLDSQQPLWVYTTLAVLLKEESRFTEAIPVYQKIVALKQKEVGPYYLDQAEKYLQQNQIQQAVIAYHHAITPQPEWMREMVTTDNHSELQSNWPYISLSREHLPTTLPKGKPWPKISIITPTYNQGEFIEETILSVINQNYPNIEYILIDGGSTDDTMTVVNKYRSYFSYVVSEPDKGQSNAINKGFRQATGDIVTWLNSDDLLAPGALYAAALAFYTSGADVVAGMCQIFKDVFKNDKEIMRHVTSCASGPMPLEEILDLENCWLLGKFFHQPEVMFTRAIWEKIGGEVNESLYYSMDYELWAKLAVVGARIQTITHPIAQFRMHEAQKTSTTEKYRPELITTRDQLRSQYGYENEPVKPAQTKRHKLRIVLFSDLGCSGGAGVAHEEIGKSLALAGHEVIPIAGCQQWQPKPIPFSPTEAEQLISCLNPDLVILGNLHNIQGNLDLLELLTAKFPTIFVMHDQWLLTGRCAYTGKCDKYQSLCDQECPTYTQYPPLSPSEISPAFQRKRNLLLNSDNLLVLGNSHWTTNWAKTALKSSLNPELDRKIQKITLGIDLNVFQPRDQKICRQKLGLPQDKFIIITGATSIEDERKGGDHIIKALKIANLPKVMLITFGYSPPSSFHDHNFEVYHAGFIGDRTILAHYYSAADLFVGASLEETFGQTFVEAAACGTPAICYATGGVQEAICDQVTGRLVFEKNPQALAEVITQLYHDQQQLNLMRLCAPIYVASHFSTKSIYQSLVVALDQANWLDKLQLAPISKFGITQPQLPPCLYVKPQTKQQKRQEIIKGFGVKPTILGGFAGLEPPYPHLQLFSPSRWLLAPEGRFCFDTDTPKIGYLVIKCRKYQENQSLELWQETNLILRSLVSNTEMTRSNIFTLPLSLKQGPNFFTIKVDNYILNESHRALGVLIEEISFLEQLNLSTSPSLDTPLEKTILMDNNLKGTGFYWAENVDGTYVRWMEQVGSVIIDGPEHSHSLLIQVTVMAAVESRFIQDMEVKINGKAIEGKVAHQSNGQWIFEGIIPSVRLTPNSPFLISIVSPGVKKLSPNESRAASLLVKQIFLRQLT